MSRRRGDKKGEAPKASQPLVKALLNIGRFEALPCEWRPIEDVVNIIHGLYDLPRTTNVPTGLLNAQVSSDAVTMAFVDVRQFNFSGIFRDTYKKKKFFYLCKPGDSPPKPPPGERWHQSIVPLKAKWSPDRNMVDAFALTSFAYVELRDALKEGLPKKNNPMSKMPAKKKSLQRRAIVVNEKLKAMMIVLTMNVI
jgi:hypothetical protein